MGFPGRSWIDFWLHLGREKGAKTEPKTTKNQSKNRLKKRSHFRTVLRPSWGDLGSILAPSWRPRRVKIVLSPRVALIFLKIDLFEEKWSQDASWDDLGSIWVAKRGRLGRPFGT